MSTKNPGVEVKNNYDAAGMRASGSHDAVFTGVVVSRVHDPDASRVLSDPVIRLNRTAVTLRGRPRVWALTLLVCVVACASPVMKTSDTRIASEEPPPRFGTAGPDAEELGASMGYPKGTPATVWRTRSQVGSLSHLDEIFRGRLIHKAPTLSRLVRVAEPRITWMSLGADAQPDDGPSDRTGRHDSRRALPVRAHGPASLHLMVDGQDRDGDAHRHRDRRGAHPVGGRSRRCLRARARRHRRRSATCCRCRPVCGSTSTFPGASLATISFS